MKRARFSEEQIFGILKEHEAGAKCPLPQARDVGGDVLRLEEQVWRDDGLRGEAAACARG